MRGLELDGRGRRLLALTCATGMIDAVAFLGLGQAFCAMQTGNVVFLGLGIAGTDGAPFTAPLIALCAFVAGGIAAALLLRAGAATGGARGTRAARGVTAAPGAARGVRAARGTRAAPGAARGVRAAVTVEIGLLVLATAIAAAADPSAGETAALLTIAALAAAMGLRTSVVRGRGAANLATTVLNLTAIGGPASAGTAAGVNVASAADLAQRAAALVALLLGAVAGALLLDAALWLPLALATALTLATHALDRPELAAA